MGCKPKKKPDPKSEERQRYYAVSDENFKNELAMIAEMEASGLKVIRNDTFIHCRAKLVMPEVLHIQSEKGHSYYPNAVRELYDRWKASQSQDHQAEG